MKAGLGISMALLALLLVSGTTDASVSIDQVQSQHIREADGTSGQYTNSGAGVKTGHIQNSAVTAAKIADGSITAAKLAIPIYTKAEVDALISGLQTQVAALQSLLLHFSRNGDDVSISGANLHIVNGIGGTSSANGLGNLVVGYNETRDNGTDNRTGSHNIVAGLQNNFSSYGGLVIGQYNEISAQYAAVTGGAANIAAGDSSSVTGGSNNQALGPWSQVSGGTWNTATGGRSTVSGGGNNIAEGAMSSVSGGEYCTASGNWSSVSGGKGSVASGDGSAVSGGYMNFAPGEFNWAAGSLFEIQ